MYVCMYVCMYVQIYHVYRRGYRIFWRGGGVMATRGGGVIAPVGEKLLFEHTTFSATRGGDHPYHPTPPVSATAYTCTYVCILSCMYTYTDAYIHKCMHASPFISRRLQTKKAYSLSPSQWATYHVYFMWHCHLVCHLDRWKRIGRQRKAAISCQPDKHEWFV